MSRKRKIAIVCSREPWRIGGVERVVAETTKRLKIDFNLEIFCIGEKTETAIWEEIPVHVFKGHTAMYPFSLSLYKELKTKLGNFDLIHSHNFATFSTLASILANKKGVPVVFSPHFNPAASKSSYSIFRPVYDRTLGKYVLRRTDFIIYASEAERNLVESRFGIKKKGAVIHYGADIAKLRDAEPYTLGQENVVLYLGRLLKSKNVHHIIMAMEALPNDFYLYVIGEGNYSPQLRKLITKLNLGKRVKMVGPVYGESVSRWMKTCSVFVQLSESESYGLTCIEALAAGKPVVVNDNKTGLTELATLFKGSIRPVNVKSQSTQDIAKVIMDVSGMRVNPDLSKFDWDYTAEGFKRAYLSLLGD